MPGMGQAPSSTDPLVVSAFHDALAHQGLLILLLLALIAIGWNSLRTWQYRRSMRDGGALSSPDQDEAEEFQEPGARRLLRIGFGILWLGDGLLQLQSAMPLGIPGAVIQPAASPSRGWVQATVNVGVTIWERHPVQAAAATVWIQLGLGALLLVSSRGHWSRFSGVASVAWGLVVWIFGEAFGGIFAPGLSWLFGAPGSAFLYVIAGLLIAMPQRLWSEKRLGRRMLVGAGSFFLIMAVLQAWPGRGFWQGVNDSSDGSLSSMLRQMVSTPQPHLLDSLVSSFLRFDLAHGWAVNLFVVIALAVIGTLLCTSRLILIRIGLVSAILLCLVDWVLVQDLGIFGGTGTDPNTMPPMILLIVVGYMAFARPKAWALRPEKAPRRDSGPSWARVSGKDLARVLAALGAMSVVLVGAIPMAFASVNSKADPIVSEATDGTPNVVDFPAPAFALVDQSNHSISLSALRGRVVALTFLDPVCTSDCPVIAQEFREADDLLGGEKSQVAFVAIVTNQLYRSVSAVDAFDNQEDLEHVPNWLFLTGTTKELERVWNAYGVQEQVEPAGAMVAHTDVAYVIDESGDERVVLDANPTPGSVGTSSFVTLLASELRRTLSRQ